MVLCSQVLCYISDTKGKANSCHELVKITVRQSIYRKSLIRFLTDKWKGESWEYLHAAYLCS